MPRDVYRKLVKKAIRTQIYFRSGSKVVALPNNEDTIRGHKAHLAILDEAAFFGNDESMLRNVVTPMLATTGGTLILSSTPWGKNSAFYRLSRSPQYTQFHITWETPCREGVYDESFKHEIHETQKQNPLAYQTEYLAEFSEEADTWLTQTLLAKAIDPNLEYQPYNKPSWGIYYAGIDLAERVDHSALAILERKNRKLKLVHLHQFKLGEDIGIVLGYMNILASNWRRIIHCHIDNTKHGDHIVNDFNNYAPSTGVYFTQRTKMHLAHQLKTRLTDNTLTIPFHRATMEELNTVTSHLTKTGLIQYDHPRGTHDDRFWALALALNAAETHPPRHHPTAKTA